VLSIFETTYIEKIIDKYLRNSFDILFSFLPLMNCPI